MLRHEEKGEVSGKSLHIWLIARRRNITVAFHLVGVPVRRKNLESLERKFPSDVDDSKKNLLFSEIVCFCEVKRKPFISYLVSAFAIKYQVINLSFWIALSHKYSSQTVWDTWLLITWDCTYVLTVYYCYYSYYYFIIFNLLFDTFRKFCLLFFIDVLFFIFTLCYFWNCHFCWLALEEYNRCLDFILRICSVCHHFICAFCGPVVKSRITR